MGSPFTGDSRLQTTHVVVAQRLQSLSPARERSPRASLCRWHSAYDLRHSLGRILPSDYLRRRGPAWRLLCVCVGCQPSAILRSRSASNEGFESSSVRCATSPYLEPLPGAGYTGLASLVCGVEYATVLTKSATTSVTSIGLQASPE